MRAAVIAAAGLVAFAAWELTRRQGQAAQLVGGGDWELSGDWLAQADDVLTETTTTAAEWIDQATGGLVTVSAMRNVNVTADVLENPNVRAMLRVIRAGEGTDDEGGYKRLFGGGTFDSFADHPRVLVEKSGYKSTAAGAYQFLSRTWDETRRTMGLPDFSPRSQDLGAVGRLAARGALQDTMAGRFESAIAKIAREWASLPGSPYGQPTISMTRAKALYASAGGVMAGGVYV